jgi:hypothetical protein
MFEADGPTITLPAYIDLSSYQYYPVIATGQYVTVASAVTDHPIGILLNKPSAKEGAASICIGGRCKAKIGGTTALGTLLGVDTDGMLIPVTADTKRFCAVALDIGADGDIIDVLVVPYSQLSSAVGA